MSRKDSDLLYFSVLVLMAVFAVPAFAGPCLALDECGPPVASDCHDESGEQAVSCCCGVEAVPAATLETLKLKESAWLVDDPQLPGAAGHHVPALEATLEPLPPPTRGEPLFVINSCFLI